MREPERIQTPEARSEVRRLVGGLLINIGLTIGKFIIGTATHCAALVADGYKDLSDAARTGLTLSFNHMKEDVREHRDNPTKVARIEFIASHIVFVIIILMGVRSFTNVAQDVLDQHDTRYTPALYIITALSVVIKAYMAHHKRGLACRINDTSLLGEARRAAVDSVVAALILAAGILDHVFSIDIDPWIGAGIAVLIAAAGIYSLLRKKNRKAAAPCE